MEKLDRRTVNLFHKKHNLPPIDWEKEDVEKRRACPPPKADAAVGAAAEAERHGSHAEEEGNRFFELLLMNELFELQDKLWETCTSDEERFKLVKKFEMFSRKYHTLPVDERGEFQNKLFQDKLLETCISDEERLKLLKKYDTFSRERKNEKLSTEELREFEKKLMEALPSAKLKELKREWNEHAQHELDALFGSGPDPALEDPDQVYQDLRNH